MLKILTAGLIVVAAATAATGQPVWRHYPPPGAFPAPPPRTLPTPPEILRTYDAATGTAAAGTVMLTPLPDVGPDALSPLAPAVTDGAAGLEPIEAMRAVPADAARPPQPNAVTDSDPVTTGAIAGQAADPSPAPSPAVVAVPPTPSPSAPTPAPAASVADSMPTTPPPTMTVAMATPSARESTDNVAAAPVSSAPMPQPVTVPVASPAHDPSAGGWRVPVLPGALAGIIILAGALLLLGRRRAAGG